MILLNFWKQPLWENTLWNPHFVISNFTNLHFTCTPCPSNLPFLHCPLLSLPCTSTFFFSSHSFLPFHFPSLVLPPFSLLPPPTSLLLPPSSLFSPPSSLFSPLSSLFSPPTSLFSPPSSLFSPPSSLLPPPSSYQRPPCSNRTADVTLFWELCVSAMEPHPCHLHHCSIARIQGLRQWQCWRDGRSSMFVQCVCGCVSVPLIMSEYGGWYTLVPHECQHGTYTHIYICIYSVSPRGHPSIEWIYILWQNSLATASMNNPLPTTYIPLMQYICIGMHHNFLECCLIVRNLWLLACFQCLASWCTRNWYTDIVLFAVYSPFRYWYVTPIYDTGKVSSFAHLHHT